METDLSGKTVLIVDDNLTNLRILKHQLEAWEMEVAVAHNAEEALTFLAKAHFDVAILDMQMPDMDGLQLTQHIRSSAALKEMRLILMTSVDQTQAQEHLKSLGLDANLRKPVTRTQLNNCLSRVLGRAAVESRPRSWKKHSFSTEQEHDTSKLDLSGVKVLLVEDNPINRRVTSLQMEKLGVKPDLASSGLQAVELFKKTRHDIILMDCQMPEMDGFETTREIRRLGEKLGQPVILALTANVMEGDRQNCIDAGMDDYLGKPLAFPQLSATLRKWTRSSR
jgi:CheY-like chemotaxis protein